LVLTDVTVIDGSAAAARPSRTVIITGDRIAAIVDAADNTAIPKGARVIRARGTFLIPGLWDMHVHLQAKDLAALVAYGVTGVRDMGNVLSDVDSWRAQIAAGTLVGPRIFRVGPILNGKAFGPAHVEVASAAEARAAVRVLKHTGVDAVKIHRALSREAYFTLSDESKRLSIPFVGHIPQAVTAQEASDAGQASFEHMETLFEGNVPLKREEAPALFTRFVKNNNSFTPTLANYRGSTEPANIDPELLRKYPDLPAGRKRIFQMFVGLVGVMNQAGVTLMTGSDLGSKWVAPGTSLHDELALFVEAGLTPMEALRAATLNPARFLRVDAGTVEAGKLADLVLLDANPLDDIRNTRKIRAVIVRGKLFDRSELLRR
jgi:imidazolonepropionase-like amidohydrolase